MAFTYDLTTVIGKLRLQIGDTKEATAFFSDEELQAFLDAQSGDQGKAAIQALRSWARTLMQKPKEQIGDYTVDYGSVAKNLLAAADALAEELDDDTDDVVIGEAGGFCSLDY